MNIQRIKADIDNVKIILSGYGNPTNDEYLLDIAAYHTQQAIEKCLKYYLHDVYKEDDTKKKFKTHNLSTLALWLSSYDKNFMENHEGLIDLLDEVTNWEASSRYGESIISTRKDINKAITYAEELYKEVYNHFELQNTERKFENESDKKEIEVDASGETEEPEEPDR